MGRLHFVVEAQAAGFDQPAKGALDDPALGQEFETFGLAAAAHDLQMQPAKGTQGLHPCDQLACIAAVGPVQASQC